MRCACILHRNRRTESCRWSSRARATAADPAGDADDAGFVKRAKLLQRGQDLFEQLDEARATYLLLG
jgi:hypothetical protein